MKKTKEMMSLFNAVCIHSSSKAICSECRNGDIRDRIAAGLNN
jgi:hypothetical protein